MMYALGAIAFVICALVVWRYTSVTRGARKRDDRLLAVLDPIAERLSRKEAVTPEEITNVSRQPQFRPMLYPLLKHFERLDLFPPADMSTTAQGAGLLAYWLMHPNELQDAPSEIELVQEVDRDLQGKNARYLVFRYRMPTGHWAERNGWILGLAGPFLDGDVPYPNVAAGFSRCNDKFGEMNPADLVDWYIGMINRKGGFSLTSIGPAGSSVEGHVDKIKRTSP